jgi:hypothetical protein
MLINFKKFILKNAGRSTAASSFMAVPQGQRHPKLSPRGSVDTENENEGAVFFFCL